MVRKTHCIIHITRTEPPPLGNVLIRLSMLKTVYVRLYVRRYHTPTHTTL